MESLQVSSSNFWRSLVFAGIVRSSSAHVHTLASVAFCRSSINQASAAEYTSFFLQLRQLLFHPGQPVQTQAPGFAGLPVHSLIRISSSSFVLNSSESSRIRSDTNRKLFTRTISVVFMIFLTVPSSASRSGRRTFCRWHIKHIVNVPFLPNHVPRLPGIQLHSQLIFPSQTTHPRQM